MIHRPSSDPKAAVAEPAGRWIALVTVSVALVLGMSTWFSASAVIPQLDDVWHLSSTGRAWLTIAVQLGFVAGALVSGVLNVSDRFRARFVILVGGVGAGAANLAVASLGDVGPAIVMRFATGFFMAAVYPPAFKLISTWFRKGRGLALGTLAGALITGTALPHLVNFLGSVDWRDVIVATSALSAMGGLLALTVREGPYPFPRSAFDPRQVGKVFASRAVRLASIGYFGHMWELFAMYAWFLVFFSDHVESGGAEALPGAALVTFLVISAGGPGSFVAGVLADRWGRSNTTILALAISGACSLGIGLLYEAPTWLVVAVGLLWGLTVVADSAQFSAIVTEVADQSYVGTALTMQLAVGFTITVATIWLIPVLEEALSWRWAFAILALGPVVGIAAMRRLRSLPESARIAGGLG